MLAESQARALLAAAVPLHAYAARGRGRAELTAYQMAHIQDIEAILNAAADLLDALTPPEPSAAARQAARVIAFHADPAPLTTAKLSHHYPDALPELHPTAA